MQRFFKLAALATALGCLGAQADEGMWQPHQLPQLKQQLVDKGLKIDPDAISTLTEFPMNAVISLGGCTASFVSPKGLAVTNHHCAYGSIQYNSSADNNLLDKGFLAKRLADELKAAPGSRIYVTESLTNVTESIVGGLDSQLAGEARYRAIEANEKAAVAACEADQGYRCEIYSFHGGLEYYLIKQLAIRDVRLVYAPPSNIGKFGGDTDNWMWPRHTGDWSFYRAYVGKDGKPADYSPDNVPFEPKSHLKVSARGVEDQEFVMVAGYPGRTNRYRTANEVENQFTWVYPMARQYREEMIDIIKQIAPKGSDARIKYESTIARLANYAKNYGSMVESYNKGDMLARKRRLEAELAAWVKGNPDREAKYGKALDELNALVAEGNAHQARELILAYMKRSALMPVAGKLYRLANEKTKPDGAREPGFQERDMTRFTQKVTRLSRRYHQEVDAALVTHFARYYAALPQAERLPALDRFFGLQEGFDEKRFARQLAAMYRQSELHDEAKRLAWMTASVADFKASKDPFIQLAVAMYDTEMALERADKDLIGRLQQVRPQYMAALIAYQKSRGKPVYADANSSLRVTYGNVKGYSPADGLYARPFTTLEGKLAKYIPGDAEFDATQRELKMITAKQYGDYYNPRIGSVPVNYLSTVDTTGGNSGSPTLNGDAELVGLLFDGVYESIIADWDFDDDLTRSIHLDSRYMLWVMEYVSGADNLLAEMEIVR